MDSWPTQGGCPWHWASPERAYIDSTFCTLTPPAPKRTCPMILAAAARRVEDEGAAGAEGAERAQLGCKWTETGHNGGFKAPTEVRAVHTAGGWAEAQGGRCTETLTGLLRHCAQ